MTNKQNPKFQELVTKLREIFQIDRPELDFGIYRILNARAGEINDYLENRLPAKVEAALSSGNDAQREQVARELQEKEAQYEADGINPETVPRVQELRQKLRQYTSGANEHENAVFSHLLTFFSRYYHDGDFISQRRYKGDTYAIPYAGEEVMLHWANKDQYYTKSGENFSNYSFKLPEENGKQGRTVHFRLVAADTAKDNRKDNDKERRFALVAAKTVTRVDENGDEYEEELRPIEEVRSSDGSQELIIHFEYAAQPKGTKQETLITKAVETVLADETIKTHWLSLSNRAPTEKNPQRTLLEKHITDYTTKNTADYFIHKDLGGFLRRELDFYIKNEVMHLDDVQNAGVFADIEKNLRMIQCLRSIALELITFLAQLEDFQKTLWLKKKFVVSSHYCITLDRIPEELYPEIVANERQWEEWKRLGIWEGGIHGTLKELISAPYRMIDTSLFDDRFQAKVIAAQENITISCVGILIHSENFHALTLLQNRYKNKINCVHIDPPYNTQTSGFLYKNSYQHSSWLAMMRNRISTCYPLLKNDGHFQCHIDENEYESLIKLMDDFSWLSGGTIIWDKRNPMNGGKGLANQHEYIIWKSPNAATFVNRNKSVLSIINAANQFIDQEGGVTENARRKFSSWVSSNNELSGGEKAYRYLDENGRVYQSVSLRAPEPRTDPKFHKPLIHPTTGKPCAMPPNGFSRTPETLSTMQRKGEILFGEDETTQPRQKVFLKTETGRQVSSMIQNAKKGKADTERLGLDFPYCHPVSLYEDTIGAASKTSNEIVLDFFAGSGTTAHAVLNLNRDDEQGRKYILVEMGAHFETTVKPRIIKLVYSKDWTNGKPTAPETGISHCFKVLKLESYEDTLNNLQLRRTTSQGELLNGLPQQAKDDYLLRYMLDVESRGSLLSVEDFKKPFDYTLNVAMDSAGAFEPRKVDLVETFNYLIGLRVKRIDAQPHHGFVTVTGTLPSGESCLVLWRDCEILDYEGINKLCDKLAIDPANNEYDVVYINGDHNIPTVFTQTAKEGGATRSLKLRQIEPEFLERMFAVEDV
ncbi:MAG: site-specific DNA-methyltransferase [Pusillimonas sp.]|nr:site-specific DNA-methyltransferase [Pusillimonas sp.]